MRSRGRFPADLLDDYRSRGKHLHRHKKRQKQPESALLKTRTVDEYDEQTRPRRDVGQTKERL